MFWKSKKKQRSHDETLEFRRRAKEIKEMPCESFSDMAKSQEATVKLIRDMGFNAMANELERKMQ